MKPTYKIDEDTGEIFRQEGEAAPVLLAQFHTIDGKLIVKSEEGERYLSRVGRLLSEDSKEVKQVEHFRPVVAEVAVAKPAGIPPPPPMTKRDGDKTPAYVEWMFRHFPEEAKAKYGVIGEGMVTRIDERPEPITGRPIRTPRQEKALLSTRKIHLTEKPHARD